MIKKIMLKNFSIEPNQDTNEDFENAFKETQKSLMSQDK